MATTKPSPELRARMIHDRIVAEIDNWTDEKTLESVIQTQQRIARYERVHRMSSATMRRKLLDGEIDETKEMVSWSFDLDTLDQLLAEYS